MFNYYVGVLKNYAGFTGRARRAEFWQFTLVSAIISIVLSAIGAVMGNQILDYIYSVAVLIPGLAVAVRRLHDTGKSGWWLLIAIVPIIGAIALIVFLCIDSEAGANQHGPNPKAIGSPAGAY